MDAPVTWTQVTAIAGTFAVIGAGLWLRWVAAGMPGARERR